MESNNNSKGSITTTVNNKSGVIFISGSFAFNAQHDFRKAYESLAKKCTSIRLDFSNTSYMDSSGLGMLLVMKKYLDQLKINYELQKVAGQVSDLLQLTYFSKYFQINGHPLSS